MRTLKRWVIAKQDQTLVDTLCQRYSIHEAVARVMINRGVVTQEAIIRFLKTQNEGLYDPFLLKGMDLAVARVHKAIEQGETVCVYGDYDVDGITSTTSLYLFLKALGVSTTYYIPDRIEEGYGLNKQALETILADGAHLVISVDTGIVAFEEAAHAKAVGLDLIITDHHEATDSVPDAVAVIDPKQPGCTYPFKGLAGVGVTFKLIQGIAKILGKEDQVWPYLELVAIGTIADLVPLMDENRIMTKLAFKTLSKTWNLGIRQLMAVAEIKPDTLKSGDVAFQIGPRLNAAGRMGDAKKGVALLTTKDRMESLELAQDLNTSNQKRKQVERELVEAAVAQIEENHYHETDTILVVVGDHWPHGVIGIVASRILERYYKPTVILTAEADVVTGSARSVEGFNLHQALSSCKDLFHRFGGHEMAAGMSLDLKDVDCLRERLNTYAKDHLEDHLLQKKLLVDFELPLSAITEATVTALYQLEPYGVLNQEPYFLVSGILKQKRVIGQHGNHLKLILESNKATLEAIGFFMAEDYFDLQVGEAVRLVGTLNLNVWQGQSRPQMMVVDIQYDEATQDALVTSVRAFKAVLAGEREPEVIDRPFMVGLYKQVKDLCLKVPKSTVSIGVKNFGLEKPLKRLIGLEIFSQLGLLDYQLEGLLLHVSSKVHEQGKKVELEQSKLYNECIKVKEKNHGH